MNRPVGEISILGGGLAGSLCALLMARRGFAVDVYEFRADMRRETIPAGRSINLALAARGIEPLKRAGVFERVEPMLIPMRGRMLHDHDGTTQLLPYGQRADEVVYSVTRGGLNALLMNAAETAGAQFHFRQRCVACDFESSRLIMRDESSAAEYRLPLQTVIAADGGGSVVRRALSAQLGHQASEQLLDHGYKELTIPAAADGGHRMEKHALHIWPRGEFMLIALPNPDSTFTVTLFLPNTGTPGFASLTDEAALLDFFGKTFPDTLDLIPGLTKEFFANPTGELGTVRCSPWHYRDQALLIGDAAHAVVPFHGQGMNCAFEDCAVLDDLVASHGKNWEEIFSRLTASRKPNADAIADMALENYVEMRDTVRDPGFQLRKELAFELERRLPDRFIPRYSMVMFHAEIPYSQALQRGKVQLELLRSLTATATTLAEIDMDEAERRAREKLSPLG